LHNKKVVFGNWFTVRRGRWQSPRMDAKRPFATVGRNCSHYALCIVHYALLDGNRPAFLHLGEMQRSVAKRTTPT